MSDHKISVVVFTDDAALGELLKYLLALQGDIEVVAIADNVQDLYEHIRQLTPEVVTIVSDPDVGEMIAEDIHTNVTSIYVITWDSEKFRQDAGELADGLTMSGASSFKAPNELANAIRSVRSREQEMASPDSGGDEDYLTSTDADEMMDHIPQAQPQTRGLRTRGGANFEAPLEAESKSKGLFGRSRRQTEDSKKAVSSEAESNEPVAMKPAAGLPREKAKEELASEEEAEETRAEPKPANHQPAPPPPATTAAPLPRRPLPGGQASRGAVELGGNVAGDISVPRDESSKSDEVEGDKITVDNISGSDAIAIGRGASADAIHGDKVEGDKVMGNKIVADNVTIVNREEALKYETQARRFDAAFPEKVEHKKTATLWVGVAMPDAPPPFEGATAATATKGPTADIKLPVNPETGEAEEVQIDVEIRAPQYEPSVDRATLTIYPDGTADKVKFLLEAQDEGEGVVMVRFYLDKKRLGEIELSSVVQKARAGMKFGLKLQVATVYLAFGMG